MLRRTRLAVSYSPAGTLTRPPPCAAACLYGLPEAPLEDISIVNTQSHLTEDTPSFPVMNAVQQPVTLAGLTAEHVRGLHLTDLRIVGARGETVTLHDVE